MVSDHEIIACYLKLKAGRKVAQTLRISEQRVYRVLQKNGIERTGLKEYRDRSRKFSKAGVAGVIHKYQTGISAVQVAKELGCSNWTVLNVLKRAGIKIRSPKPPMTAKEKLKIRALYSGGLTFQQVVEKTGRHWNSVRLLVQREFPDIARPKIGPGGAHWKGGKTLSHGYVYVWIPDDDPMVSMRGHGKNVLEHRLVMARKLGRPLLATETVHHIDGNKVNNGPENLELRQGKHGKHIVMRCLDCGSHNIGPTGLSA